MEKACFRGFVLFLFPADTAISHIFFAAKGSDEEKNVAIDLTRAGKTDVSNLEQIKIEGQIFGADLKVQSSLRVLLQELKNSPAISNAKLIKSSPLKEGEYNKQGIQFEIYIFPATAYSA